jgi:hypothetical protein
MLESSSPPNVNLAYNLSNEPAHGLDTLALDDAQRLGADNGDIRFAG